MCVVFVDMFVYVWVHCVYIGQRMMFGVVFNCDP